MAFEKSLSEKFDRSWSSAGDTQRQGSFGKLGCVPACAGFAMRRNVHLCWLSMTFWCEPESPGRAPLFGRAGYVVLLFLPPNAMIHVQAITPRFVRSNPEVPSGRCQSQRLPSHTDPPPSRRLGWLIGQGLRRLKEYAD
jgi:hypothetical protein